jgi:iron complex outermembrane receptor protein
MTNILNYENAGKNRTAGVELAADYRLPRITANLNLTWTRTFESNLMGINFEGVQNDIDDNNNTPAIVMNTVVAWQATSHLRFHAHLLFESKQSAYYTDMTKLALYLTKSAELYMYEEETDEYRYLYEETEQIKKEINAKRDIPARAIINVGAEYKIGKLTLGLNVHNLLNTHYNRSGMNTALVPQQGRWWMASASYQF